MLQSKSDSSGKHEMDLQNQTPSVQHTALSEDSKGNEVNNAYSSLGDNKPSFPGEQMRHRSPINPLGNEDDYNSVFIRDRERPHCVSECFIQTCSTMRRLATHKRRSMCSTCCGFAMPIMFVLFTVLIWSVTELKTFLQEDFMNMTTTESMEGVKKDLMSTICYDPSSGIYVTEVPLCNDSVTSSLYCSKPYGLSYEICYNPLLVPFMENFNTFLVGSAAFMPTFDEIAISRVLLTGEDCERNVLCGSKLYFTPKNSATESLVKYFESTTKYFKLVYGGTYDIPEMESIVKQTSKGINEIWAIIQVNEMTSEKLDVTIRTNRSMIPDSESILVPDYAGGLGKGAERYISSGFVTLQNMTSAYYVKNVKRIDSVNDDFLFVPMSTASYELNNFLITGKYMVSIMVVMGFLYTVSQLTRIIVIEKELRIYEAILIMGLKESVIYASFFFLHSFEYALVSLIITSLMKASYLKQTSCVALFLLLFIFSLSIIALSAMIAAFFSKAKLAGFIAPIIFFACTIPSFSLSDSSEIVRIIFFVFSPSTFLSGVNVIFEKEIKGGVKISEILHFKSSQSMGVILLAMFLDIFLYFMLMMYLNAVVPKTWGTTRNPFFFIIDPIRYFFCNRSTENNNEDGRASDGVFEEVENLNEYSVQIRGLRKKYRQGKKTFVAVNNLYWQLREGEISALLGHNGAGKTTTMNLITGMIEPDDGDCYVYGLSVRKQLSKVRQEIGFCPQHNILWPDLTCREHLEYYASIKGIENIDRKSIVDWLICAVDLKEKEHDRSKELSGGQKRKLSMAIAFVGQSRLIFLDEPTAGMDVSARRYIWDLLKRISKRHTILLTTHYMDEADLLGSQVAIMSRGRLQCAGSNMFLKSKLGAGYVLTMSVVPHVDREAILSLVKSHVKSADAIGTGTGEMALRLPMNERDHFSKLLLDIEEHGDRVGVNGYSMSATTLEEIFLRIAEEHTDSKFEENQRDEETRNLYASVWNVDVLQRECAIMNSQFKSMMTKRLRSATRDYRIQFFQMLLPVICVTLGMLLTLHRFSNPSSIDLDSNSYPSSVDIAYAKCSRVFPSSVKLSKNSQITPFDTVSQAEEMSKELLSTYFSHGNNRYGGFFCGMNTNYGYKDVIFYNTSSLHEPPIGVSTFYKGIVQAKDAASQYIFRAHPLPKSDFETKVDSDITAVIVSIIIMIPFTFIPATFVTWIVRERECKALHLQKVSGLHFTVYWFSNFLFDFSSYVITITLILIVFAVFSAKEYIGLDNFGPTVVCFLLYGISGISMAYVLSFLFNEHSKAQNVVMMANFIVGFLLVLTVAILSTSESMEHASKIMQAIFRVVPSYCIGESIKNLALLRLKKGTPEETSPWDMDCVGWPCVYMACEIPIFFLLVLIIDHPARRQFFQRLFHNPHAIPDFIEDEEDDVQKERESVCEHYERQNDLIILKNLRKKYFNGTVAVRNLTLGIHSGEVFGFLGTNGAGKTTTISILCQEFLPTSGYASICGHDIVQESSMALRCIGYCPQFDACLDLLTVEEHLYMYAGVRGVLYELRKDVVEGLLKMCELTEYRNTLSSELSGGNRRKLSVAISLVGGPRVVFMDEPSAGMDPVARRGLWNVIQAVADNCSVVLTTHHLEEVEALAHRVAIMVDGTLRCIGDKTHLKNKYGNGFEVTVRLNSVEEECVERAVLFFKQNLPGSNLQEQRSNRLTFSLPKTTPLSKAFDVIQSNHKEMGFSDYYVSQTSIEQVFLRISEEAEMERDEKRGNHKGTVWQRISSILLDCCS